MLENTKPSAPVHVESRFEKRKNDIITPTPTSIELFEHIDHDAALHASYPADNLEGQAFEKRSREET